MAVPTVAVVVTDAPLVTESVPSVAVFPLIVPSVFVPVDEVNPVAKVVAPRIVGMVAVLIVAVPADNVPMVAVPVEEVMLDPNVMSPS